MTDSELKGLAAQALNMAKRDLEKGGFNFLLASYHHGEGLYRMKKIEALIVAKLGATWLNSGRTKDAGFRVLRLAVDARPPDAIVFVSILNRFRVTEKFEALAEEQKIELLHAGHDCHHQAVKDGLMTVGDSLGAIAQTPERVCNYMQDIDGSGFVGQPETMLMPQSEFGGRMKMFGEDEVSGA